MMQPFHLSQVKGKGAEEYMGALGLGTSKPSKLKLERVFSLEKHSPTTLILQGKLIAPLYKEI